MEQARLIIDAPTDGAWNMAVDQALMETANETGLITLRFYRWSQPTLSLGYFQNHLDRAKHPPSLQCPMVRRRTGGGAILHDQELTYSLSIPSTHRWSSKNSELYLLVHNVLVSLFNQHGGNSSLYENQERSAGPEIDQAAFLCFQRRSPGDIVLNGNKVVGSAQRRLKSALLQHGSILLNRSIWAPELPGLGELGCKISIDETIEKSSLAIKSELAIELTLDELTTLETMTANRALSAFFGSDNWNRRR